MSRRDALAKLGLAATVAYAAPTLLQLKGVNASGSGGGTGGRHSRGRKKRH